MLFPRRLCILSLIALSVAPSCGTTMDIADDVKDVLPADPSDPNSISRALQIPRGTRVSGRPPTPSEASRAPMISLLEADPPSLTGGGQISLTVRYPEDTSPSKAYLQVRGAGEYHLIEDWYGFEDYSDRFELDFYVSSTALGGDFTVEISLQDASGYVSSPVSTSISLFAKAPPPPIPSTPSSPSKPTTPSTPSSSGGLVCSPVNGAGGCSMQFCANQALTSCYYTVNGSRYTCSGCTGSAVQSCASTASDAFVSCLD